MRNVTQFTSAMRGPHQKLWNNWNPIEKFAPVWEIAQIRARNALLCSATHSIRLFRNLIEPRAGPDLR